jgi:hypothetical protein
VKKTSVESTAASQTAKKSTKPVATFTPIKLPPKSVLTRNLFAPLKTTDTDMETNEAENALPEQEAPRKPGRPPTTVTTSTTNLIRILNDLKDQVEGEYEIRNTRNGTRIITKETADYSLMKSLPGKK